jgi:hypothetical protein
LGSEATDATGIRDMGMSYLTASLGSM